MFPDKVKKFILGGDREVVRECRRCGMSVTPEAEACPHCGPDSSLVEYDIR